MKKVSVTDQAFFKVKELADKQNVAMSKVVEDKLFVDRKVLVDFLKESSRFDFMGLVLQYVACLSREDLAILVINLEENFPQKFEDFLKKNE